ncbi:MAG: acylphosphatase [Gammaproteobacteria bacterium]|jgi:acylphosphatase
MNRSPDAVDAEGARFIVSGRVQGVGFRASTQKMAHKMGVGGTVRNLPDGRVEVLAYGTQACLSALADWLQVGPRFARVDALERTVIVRAVSAEFRIV